jgi:hypothetical protein
MNREIYSMWVGLMQLAQKYLIGNRCTLVRVLYGRLYITIRVVFPLFQCSCIGGSRSVVGFKLRMELTLVGRSLGKLKFQHRTTTWKAR